MGGEVNWNAIELMAELLGEEDIEAFITRLACIRDWKRENRD